MTKARIDAPGLDGDADGNPSDYSPGRPGRGRDRHRHRRGHLDLDGGKVIAFKDFVNGRTTPYDDNGHGTHVAATIAGDGDGARTSSTTASRRRAASSASRCSNSAGSGSFANVIAALDWS